MSNSLLQLGRIELAEYLREIELKLTRHAAILARSGDKAMSEDLTELIEAVVFVREMTVLYAGGGPLDVRGAVTYRIERKGSSQVDPDGEPRDPSC